MEFKLVSQIKGPRLLGPETLARFRALTPNQPLIMEREPTNPVHTNAIMLKDLFLRPVGYMAWADADVVAPLLGRETGLLCKVHGGIPDILVYRPPPEPKRAATRKPIRMQTSGAFGRARRKVEKIQSRLYYEGMADAGSGLVVSEFLETFGGEAPRTCTEHRAEFIFGIYLVLGHTLRFDKKLPTCRLYVPPAFRLEHPMNTQINPDGLTSVNVEVLTFELRRFPVLRSPQIVEFQIWCEGVLLDRWITDVPHPRSNRRTG